MPAPYENITATRSMLLALERSGPDAGYLYAQEQEFNEMPEGISVIVPVHNGADEIADLFNALHSQSLDRSQFEVIFSLNGCTDASAELVRNFRKTSDIQTVILNGRVANVARARNRALSRARFRYTTFVDHDDFLSHHYLEECLALADYRTVVVSNIVRVVDGNLESDYAQTVVSDGFRVANVFGPDDISICYRAYTLNGIKTAPTYMAAGVSYSEALPHSEDVDYWRTLFHRFTPITLKSPTRRDLYYRKVPETSLSRGMSDFYPKAKPRFAILDKIEEDKKRFPSGSPQRKFDLQLRELLLDTLYNLGTQ